MQVRVMGQQSSFKFKETDLKPYPTKVIDDSKRRNNPAVIISWDNNIESSRNIDGSYSFYIKSPVPFSYFGVGWSCENDNVVPESFKIKYRTKKNNFDWDDWREVKGEVLPNETPTNLYWSNIIFLSDKELYNECEIILLTPEKINTTRVDLVDMISNNSDRNNFEKLENKDIINESNKNRGCPQPSIIPRSDWCGSFTACQNPTYTPTVIYPTHVIMHHGASPDTYTDGYSIVRSYWDYHVNTNGWLDIGYNYLVDKYGNIFQGRYNPSNTTQDVQGAHATSYNSYSIGICFLGNTDVTNSTTVQLSKLEDLLAWWFDWRGFDPTTSASINSQNLPRVMGHRDVASTTCPGNNLYNLLAQIRTNTKNNIIACNSSCTAVTIATHPQTQSVNSGSTVVFNVSVNGTPPFIYFWFKDNVLQGGPINTSATSNSFTITNLTTSDNGSYNCKINNCNNEYQAQSNDATLTVTASNQIPTISISSPSNGQSFTTQNISVAGTANDPDGSISLVQFRVNSGSWQDATGTTSWSGSVTLSSGSNTIEAKSQDNTGAWSNPVSINVTYSASNQIPTISISSPDNGQSFTTQNISVAGTANDPDGSISLVQFRVNSGSWQDATGTTSWSGSVTLSSGSNTIEAKSQDNIGAWSSIVPINVTSTVPLITITYPNGGETLKMDTTINITWTSANISGTANIELFQGTSFITSIGQCNISNQTYSWHIPTDLFSGSVYKIKILSASIDSIFDFSNTYFTILPATGIEENTIADFFKIYPNPTTGELFIENGSDMEIQKIEVYNMLGQIIIESTISDNIVNTATNKTYKLNLQSLATGNYNLKICTAKELIIKQITVGKNNK
ncbi:MAG: hypothetical protein A2X01_01510 [Bacteroidetes bacterium GWF2_35_48]|nr:MAG: hypothetical protein A2X01_01510 [Bacteroidetes bacterium GWF2_35_48]